MKFEATVTTDLLLRERHEPRLYELYHENSKLPHHRLAPQLAGASTAAATHAERFLSTRGFRQYDSGCRVDLPPPAASEVALQDLLVRRRSCRELTGALRLDELATLLGQALGCTAVLEDDTSIVHALRAWPSAGGLYPLDAYAICANVTGVAPGVYHYNPIATRLERLGTAPVDGMLADAYFNQEFAISAALSVCLVASFDRTVAKYGERGYRLVLLDAGHAAQNLLLTAEQLGLGAVAVGGFCDDALAAQLGFDGVSEAVVHTVLVGRTS